MGQLLCNVEKEISNIERMSLYFDKQEINKLDDRVNSFSQLYSIGKYLNVGKNPKLDIMWDEKLNSFMIYDEPIQNYRNSLSKPGNLEQFFKDCALLKQDYEYYMFRFFVQEKKEFKQYGLMGLPQKYRWAYWKVITFKKGIINKKVDNYSGEAIYCIKKDINRTLINDIFKEKNVIEKLDWVLSNLAYLYPKVGYCQGMNYIAGIQLSVICILALFLTVSGTQEQETVCVFSELLDSSFYMFNLLYQEELPLLFIMEEIIMKLMQVKLPKVYEHFINFKIQPSIWISKILLSGFVYLFDLLDCVLFWDYIFIKGTVLGYVELILAIVTIHQDTLLTKDDTNINEFFNFQDSNKRWAEIIIKQALSKPIHDKEIRSIMKQTNKKLGLVQLFANFGKKKEFEELYIKLSSQIKK